MDKKFLKECFLQRTNQFDALEVLSDEKVLKIGTPLEISIGKGVGEGGNPVYAKLGDKIIGVLSEEDAKDLKPYLEMKRAGMYSCIISRFDSNGDENKRFSVAIFIKMKQSEESIEENVNHNRGVLIKILNLSIRQ